MGYMPRHIPQPGWQLSFWTKSVSCTGVYENGLAFIYPNRVIPDRPCGRLLATALGYMKMTISYTPTGLSRIVWTIVANPVGVYDDPYTPTRLSRIVHFDGRLLPTALGYLKMTISYTPTRLSRIVHFWTIVANCTGVYENDDFSCWTLLTSV